ncbi:SCO family protein [Chloroflexota bacterium]
MKHVLGYLGIGMVIGLSLLFLGSKLIPQNYTFQGSLIDPPVPASDFDLIDQNQDSFRLSDQKGKVVLIFFGYTNCPDVCPVTLSEFKQIKNKLGDSANEVRFVYITVDPERDTTERMRLYISNFDPSFIGLTSDRETLEEVWKDYGVYQTRQDLGSAAGYLIDHTARIYAIDKDGNWRLTYPFGMEIEKLVEDINYLVQEK